MSSSTPSERFKCLMGTVHVRLATQCIVLYQLLFAWTVSVIALPYFVWVGVTATIVCGAAQLALHRRNSTLLMPLVMYLYFTLLLLLFLGGFIFFANIFYNKRHQGEDGYTTTEIFLFDTERFAVLLHLVNVLLLLLHMWQLSVIASCRKYVDAGSTHLLPLIRVDSPSQKAQQ